MHSQTYFICLEKINQMKVTNEFLIPFIGLKLGKHQFDFNINKTFFEDFDYHEFENCDIKVAVVLEKKAPLWSFLSNKKEPFTFLAI